MHRRIEPAIPSYSSSSSISTEVRRTGRALSIADYLLGIYGKFKFYANDFFTDAPELFDVYDQGRDVELFLNTRVLGQLVACHRCGLIEDYSRMANFGCVHLARRECVRLFIMEYSWANASLLVRKFPRAFPRALLKLVQRAVTHAWKNPSKNESVLIRVFNKDLIEAWDIPTNESDVSRPPRYWKREIEKYIDDL